MSALDRFRVADTQDERRSFVSCTVDRAPIPANAVARPRCVQREICFLSVASAFPQRL